jgi:hypothetical protein
MTVVVAQLPRPLPLADSAPQWLGPAVLLIGVASLVLWASQIAVDKMFPAQTDGLKILTRLLLTVGAVFTTIGALTRAGYFGQFNLLLTAAGRFIEGGAVIRTIRKFHYWLTERPFISEDTDSLIEEFRSFIEKRRPKIRYRAIQASIGLITVGLYFSALWVNGLTENTLYIITLTWTLSVFVLAVLGLSWKLEYAEERLAPSLIIGLILMSAGAHIYDYVNLAWDLTGIIVGLGAFLLGVVFGAVAAIVS